MTVRLNPGFIRTTLILSDVSSVLADSSRWSEFSIFNLPGCHLERCRRGRVQDLSWSAVGVVKVRVRGLSDEVLTLFAV